MRNNVIETVLGGVVICIAAFFVYMVYTSSGSSITSGYQVRAKFDRIDGLALGNDVRLSGVKIGNVASFHVDPKTYQAQVGLNIRSDVKLPLDTSAEIVSESLLGGKYISLSPGAEEDILYDQGEIIYTQSAINFEQLIGKFLFSNKNEQQ